MKPLFLALIITLLSQPIAHSQPLPDYYTRTGFLVAPPAVFDEGLLGFANPANLALLHKPEWRFIWSTKGSDAVSLQDWGVFTAVPHLGFSVQRQKFDGVGVSDFRLSTGFGSHSVALGLGYGWSSGKFDAQGREKLFSAGSIWRPNPFFSLGLVGNFSIESSNREGVGEIGIRPLGNPKLTLFADAAIQKNVEVADAPWSAGAIWQPIAGIHLVGRYFQSEAFTVGLVVNFGKWGLGGQGHFDSDAEHAQNTYFFRTGGMRPSFFPTHFDKGNRYVPFKMKGRIDYLKYRLFASDAPRFMAMLSDIQAATQDPRVSIIALNLSSMKISPELAWEIRQQLKKARKAGKTVIMFLDNVGMTAYHLASVADKVVLDPQGSILLQGYALSRTYFKGTLEKLGLGFDSWRFFKYKSANETFSRDSMSEADSLQLQAFVDDWYDLTRADVCAARHFSPEEFDRLIDDEVYFMPKEAVEVGLVDTLARWSHKDEVMTKLTGAAQQSLPAKDLLANALPQENWGALPKIAVVYGLGVCALDEGIKARWLEKVFLHLKKDASIKAVVFRVDSPGGDGMASDMVAEALKECSKNKPVIVSQGQVAGSGGYWISMYGDTIVAGPNTITGSIGVIGGWLYDTGLSRKTGMSSDWVQRGKHADLGEGVTFPFIGAELPARNLTEEERAKVEIFIKEFYDIFVQKVAAGRKMSEAEVRKIAEGRIYSGVDGKDVGLVDEIGGLITAIAMAKTQAGLDADDEVEIVEIPQHEGLFNFQQQLSPITTEIQDDPVLQFIKLVSKHPLEALPVLLPGTYPTEQ